MKKITPQTEAKLMRVLEKVASLTADGMHPNDAIIKAGENNLRPGEVELVVRAYNIGRTNCQREDAPTLQEKVATFDLADTDTVTEALFPTAVKTAAQQLKSVVVSTDYAQSGRTVANQIKAAQTAAVTWTKAASPPMSKEAQERAADKAYQKSQFELQRLQREFETKRASSAAAQRDLVTAIDNLGGYFRSPGAQPVAVVKQAACRLFNSQIVESVFSSMLASQPALESLRLSGHTKLAASSPVFELFREVVKAAGICGQREQELQEATQTVNQKRASVMPHSGVPHNCSRSILDPPLEKAALLPTFEEFGGTLRDGMSGLKQYGDTRTDPDPAIEKALYSLTDPDHEEQLRQLQAQTSFQELLAKDKLMQGRDPRQVADAYGQITQAAPNLATQPLALQSLMRKQLEQGHMDTFDINDMIGMNNNLQSRFSGMNDQMAGSR